MPKKSGKDTLAAMKEIDPGVSVILTTGYSISGEARNIIDKGAKEFIQKPFRIDDLSKKIEEVLKSKKK